MRNYLWLYNACIYSKESVKQDIFSKNKSVKNMIVSS